MKNHQPILAAVTVLIVISVAIWGSFVIFRNLFYSPVEMVDFSKLPDDVIQVQRQSFTDSKSPSISPEWVIDYHYVPYAPVYSTVSDNLVRYAKENEIYYEILAETRSALDPLKDEILRAYLWSLIEMKIDYQNELTSEAARIYYEMSADLGMESFRSKLFNDLSAKTLEASLSQVALYPVRQAEIKQSYYNQKSESAQTAVARFHKDYRINTQIRLDDLMKTQAIIMDHKILEIRDYLLEKTALIESERRLNYTEEGQNAS